MGLIIYLDIKFINYLSLFKVQNYFNYPKDSDIVNSDESKAAVVGLSENPRLLFKDNIDYASSLSMIIFSLHHFIESLDKTGDEYSTDTNTQKYLRNDDNPYLTEIQLILMKFKLEND